MVTKHKFRKEIIDEINIDTRVKEMFPTVYILIDDKLKLAYVGETTNLQSRLKSHLKHKDKGKLSEFYLLSSDYFNKSAALDIESLLIQYIPPAFNLKLLNGNAGIAGHSYYQQQDYKKMFANIWEVFRDEKVETKSLLEIENTDLFKFSPYKRLNIEQYEAVKLIIKSILGKHKNVFVDGAAGTGKTIVGITVMKILTSFHLYDEIDLEIDDDEFQRLLRDLKSKFPEGLKVGFVVPMASLRNTLKEVFAQIHGMKKAMVIGPADVNKKQYDVLVVDESHRLQRRVGITNYKSYDDLNRKLGFDNSKDQLDWIQTCSSKSILFYDSEQSIKPADVRADKFAKLRDNSKSLYVPLFSQMRCAGGNSFMKFVEDLFNGRNPDKYNNPDYEVLLFDDISKLVNKLTEKESKHGLCRLMSGYSWKWDSRYDDKPDYDVIIDGVELTWNRCAHNWINSTTDLKEMGCIHTVQGYDLNYAGIILGAEIDYDPESNTIVTDKSKYFDAKGKVSVHSEDELRNYIVKIYKTMMYRGIKGCYVYAYNENLRNYLKQYILQ